MITACNEEIRPLKCENYLYNTFTNFRVLISTFVLCPQYIWFYHSTLYLNIQISGSKGESRKTWSLRSNTICLWHGLVKICQRPCGETWKVQIKPLNQNYLSFLPWKTRLLKSKFPYHKQIPFSQLSLLQGTPSNYLHDETSPCADKSSSLLAQGHVLLRTRLSILFHVVQCGVHCVLNCDINQSAVKNCDFELSKPINVFGVISVCP